jgi:hypothetical protein
MIPSPVCHVERCAPTGRNYERPPNVSFVHNRMDSDLVSYSITWSNRHSNLDRRTSVVCPVLFVTYILTGKPPSNLVLQYLQVKLIGIV